ncbi:MAG: DUF951 domain-containing protein [SAR202 cluster bacterium]|jgi:hypothetical protein|nr:hypothetical protein [Chloroflexota bacterium]MQG48014.1 DUF951 domain-containing protein [SAR202 cluster bacterium]PKB74390.1 MAG: hypothetical protein BZY72_01970 [SAR202 cluster bacterium Io17-Chloro-G8]MAQ54328.1 hypothetical protein [Chloroflexota bacterium]MBU16432.1 hypothetical protein [Chloroflexota bacterium]|tara:strand:- start:8367 stop:8573 length:207 start_codon:yes stop_codon:yes gene_type:complete
MALELKIGDVLRMKKPHPCGGSLWTVTRLGADIGMNCRECGRYVLLARSQLARRLKQVVPPHELAPND